MSEGGQGTHSPTKDIGVKVIYAAFCALKDHGGEMRSRDVVDAVESQVELDDYACHRYAKSGYVRWKSILHFYSVDSVKAGFLVKKKGVWYLTEEGEVAMALGPEGLFETASAAYRKWRSENPVQSKGSVDGENEDEEISDTIDLDAIEQSGFDSLKAHIRGLNPYEFQDIVAALLRGMGYHTPFVAPRGKDGGIDVIAYRDPLGTVAPRIKVQVKHREETARVDEIRQLMGLLHHDGDTGLFVSSGGFTPDSKTTTRAASLHIELIDLDRFIELWLEFYESMKDEDKRLMPLRPIYFLAELE